MSFKRLFLLLTTLLFSLNVTAQQSQEQLNEQLWEATRRGDVAAVTALLDKGADVNAKFRYGTTALFKAAERGNVEVVKLLLARGADASIKDTFYGATAMTWALDGKHVEVVKALLEKDGSRAGEVLTTGVRENNLDLVRVALEKSEIKPEALTAALANTIGESEKTQIAEMLKKAGAKPPLEIDQAVLQTYVGRYKPEQGNEIVISLKDGRLFGTPTGQRSLALMALDQLTFRPVAFDGLTVAFETEGDKVNGFVLKQGQNTTSYKRVEEVKQP